MQLVNTFNQTKVNLYKWALGLAIFTVIYNVAEGVVSTILGFEDGSLTLFGFGADSFIEVVSGFGIAHKVLRIQKNATSRRDEFERTALRITGISFYLLTAGLIVTSVYNIFTAHNPITTIAGVIVSIISIFVMWALMYSKVKIGNALNSEAILADVECTRVCIYMSIIVLVSIRIFALFHLPFIDSVGTLALSYFAFKEVKECFEKAKNNKICCCH